MIDVEALRTRYLRIAGFLDERGRRLFAANEALGLGRGGVTAVFALAGENLTNLQYGGLVYLSRVGGEPEIDQNGLAARLSIDRPSRPARARLSPADSLLSSSATTYRACLPRLSDRAQRRHRCCPGSLIDAETGHFCTTLCQEI
jgi:hypothetical protein